MTDRLGSDLADKRILGPVGGRIMATLALCVLFWFSISSDRQEAQVKLRRLTPATYAAQYQKERARIKETAEQSDGYLIGMTTALAFFVLAYEGAALGFGWVLGRLADHPKQRDPAS